MKLNKQVSFFTFLVVGAVHVKRVKADRSWPLKPYKTSPSKTKEHYPRNKQEKVKLTFEYDTVGPRVKPDTINELYPMQTHHTHSYMLPR